MDYLTGKVDFFCPYFKPPVEGIFYDGQIFDAYKFAADLIRTAKKSVLLIDNCVDDSVQLILLAIALPWWRCKAYYHMVLQDEEEI